MIPTSAKKRPTIVARSATIGRCFLTYGVRVSSQPCSSRQPHLVAKLLEAAREVKEALMASLDGSRLVRYVDLPMEWRNNHYVEGGYR